MCCAVLRGALLRRALLRGATAKNSSSCAIPCDVLSYPIIFRHVVSCLVLFMGERGPHVLKGSPVLSRPVLSVPLLQSIVLPCPLLSCLCLSLCLHLYHALLSPVLWCGLMRSYAALCDLVVASSGPVWLVSSSFPSCSALLCSVLSCLTLSIFGR